MISSKNFYLQVTAWLAVSMSLILLNGQAASLEMGTNKQSVQDRSFGKLPMQFEPNEGQADKTVKFLSRGNGYNLFLTGTEAILDIRRPGPARKLKSGKPSISPRARLRMQLVGGNGAPVIQGEEAQSGIVNYFIGNDPKRWHADIHPVAKVRLEKVYTGIDLVYYGNQQHLEYDFEVSPGSDPSQIALAFDGAKDVQVDATGELQVKVANGEIKWHKPFAYQEEKGVKLEIPSRFVIRPGGQVQFALGDYDRTKTLVIDPVMVFASYFGGSGFDLAESIVPDASGNIFLAGNTDSVNLPIASAYDSSANGLNDGFVAKFNSTGTALIYSTYIGGTADDSVYGVAVDTNGNAYVVGSTEGSFPTVNAYQTSSGGLADAFIAKIGTNGNTLLYSSFLGGSDYESFNAVAVDNAGKAYVAGQTASANSFPRKNYFAGPGGSGQDPTGDSIVAKFDTTQTNANSLIYASFLGNNNSTDFATSIAVDTNGNAYVAGEVDADNGCCPSFQTTAGVVQPSFRGGDSDVYVAKINSTPGVVWATFLGGSDEDTSGLARDPGIAIDSSGFVYIAGRTLSTDFPMVNGYQTNLTGAGIFFTADCFMAKLQTNGSSVLYSTFLGGDANDAAYRIAADNFGCVYLTGPTDSDNFPTTVGCDQTNAPDGQNGFVTKINPAVSGTASLIYSSYLGGDLLDFPTSISINSAGDFFVTGTTTSTNFPVTAGVYRGTNSGSYDAFIAKFSSPRDLSATLAMSTNPIIVGSNVTFTVRVNNNGRANFTGVTNLIQIATNLSITSASSTVGTCTTNGSLVTCSIGTLTNNAVAIITVGAVATSPGTLTNSSTVAGLESEINTSNNIATFVSTVRGVADITIAQSIAPNPVVVSSNLTFIIGITNKGPWPATSIVFTDSFPAALQIVSAVASQGTLTTNGQTLSGSLNSLANGAGATVTVTLTALTNGVVTNVATTAAYDLDSNSTNNTASASVIINPLSDLGITVTASTNSPLVTSNFSYTILVTNNGPSSATNVVVTDAVPVGLTYVISGASQGSTVFSAGVVTGTLGTIAKNASATVTVTVKAPQAGNVTNTASVTSGVSDSVSSNNVASVVVTVNPLADLVLTERASANPINLASNLTLTFTISNAGPSTATGIFFSNTLPAALTYVSGNSSQGTFQQVGGTVTCNFGTLASNNTGTVSIVVQPNTFGTTTNIGRATATETDPNATNNTATLNINVSSLPTLQLSVLGTNATLSWPTSALNFVLQGTPALSATSVWTTAGSPLNLAGKYYVTNGLTNIGGSNRFYRLMR